MPRITRRTFLKTASASAAGMALWNSAPRLLADPLGLPLGLQLYSVRDLLPRDYDGTLRQLGAIGYREVEAAGFFDHNPSQVKQAMDQAGLRCLSAHYPMDHLQPELDTIIQFGKDLGLEYIICSSPTLKDSAHKAGASRANREAMTLDDWRWNAEQFNHIGERVHAAGMRFGYHNHMTEFRTESGVLYYDELLRLTDPTKVSMELDCGWMTLGGKSPADYLTRHPERFSMLHVKDFNLKGWTPGSQPPPSTELGHGSIDYRPIFEAAKKAHIKHAFVEQEEFDMPLMEALKVDADYMHALKV
ncbi:MAG: TIM barrel protein [Terriglobales bacterium]